MNSSGLCAWSMLPGPQMTVGMPVSWKRPASVPKATLPTELPPVSDLTKATISLSTGVSRPGKGRDLLPGEAGIRGDGLHLRQQLALGEAP